MCRLQLGNLWSKAKMGQWKPSHVLRSNPGDLGS